jgi:hypothetical protein
MLPLNMVAPTGKFKVTARASRSSHNCMSTRTKALSRSVAMNPSAIAVVSMATLSGR